MALGEPVGERALGARFAPVSIMLVSLHPSPAPRTGLGLALAVVAGAAAFTMVTRCLRRTYDGAGLAPPLRYEKAGERAKSDERATFDPLRKGFSHGLIKGTLVVDDHLPRALRQGLFARAAKYPVVARLTHVPGDALCHNGIATPRGIALKVIGVAGSMLGGHAGERTQDFLFTTKKTCPSMSAQPSGGYFTQVALRYGKYVAKIGLFPTDKLRAQIQRPFALRDESGMPAPVLDHFARAGAEYEISVQLCREPSASESPYVRVGRLVFPPQDAFSDARVACVEEELSFSSTHTLDAHRPLVASARAAKKGAHAEPRVIDEIPD